MKRRDFIKLAGAGVLGLVCGDFVKAADDSRPNILLIYIDDLGWNGLGYMGSDFYETPNIDRLARQGMHFTNAYIMGGTANCQPSRACLMSGQFAPRHGVYAVGSTEKGPVDKMRLVPIPNNSKLAPENVTIAEALEAGGYVTGQFGKWHLGSVSTGTDPGSQGFDVVGDYSNAPKDDPKDLYTITQLACDFMEQSHNQNRPFFCYLAHHAIHGPLEARDDMLAKYNRKKGGELHNNALYGACTTQMDDGVGIALQKLHELGIEENTVVFFMSDNGPTANSSPAPLSGMKGTHYEGGPRVPMIVRRPGVIPRCSRCDVPVMNVDFYPTFLEIAQASVPAGKILDGKSLMPLLTGTGGLGERPLFWHFPGYLHGQSPRTPNFRAVPCTVMRKGDWKLLLFYEEWVLDGGRDQIDTNNCVELYNLREDIGEKNNLALKRKDKRDELLDEMLDWVLAISAPIPTQPNPQYQP